MEEHSGLSAFLSIDRSRKVKYSTLPLISCSACQALAQRSTFNWIIIHLRFNSLSHCCSLLARAISWSRFYGNYQPKSNQVAEQTSAIAKVKFQSHVSANSTSCWLLAAQLLLLSGHLINQNLWFEPVLRRLVTLALVSQQQLICKVCIYRPKLIYGQRVYFYCPSFPNGRIINIQIHG